MKTGFVLGPWCFLRKDEPVTVLTLIFDTFNYTRPRVTPLPALLRGRNRCAPNVRISGSALSRTGRTGTALRPRERAHQCHYNGAGLHERKWSASPEWTRPGEPSGPLFLTQSLDEGSQQVLEDLDMRNATHRQLARALGLLCCEIRQLPTFLTFRGEMEEEDREVPTAGGRFSVVRKGTHNGKVVVSKQFLIPSLRDENTVAQARDVSCMDLPGNRL